MENGITLSGVLITTAILSFFMLIVLTGIADFEGNSRFSRAIGRTWIALLVIWVVGRLAMTALMSPRASSREWAGVGGLGAGGREAGHRMFR